MHNLKIIFPGNLKPKGYWTKDGHKIPDSDFEGPEGSNDVKIYFIVIQFTKDGHPHGNPFFPPDGANDVRIYLEEPKPQTLPPDEEPKPQTLPPDIAPVPGPDAPP
jgi:hypothetical protein